MLSIELNRHSRFSQVYRIDGVDVLTMCLWEKKRKVWKQGKSLENSTIWPKLRLCHTYSNSNVTFSCVLTDIGISF